MFNGILESIQRLVLNFKPRICMCIHMLQSTSARALFGLFLCPDCTSTVIVDPWVLAIGPPLLVTAINETHWWTVVLANNILRLLHCFFVLTTCLCIYFLRNN